MTGLIIYHLTRHCERSEAIQGTANQSGLPRRFAPRNDADLLAKII